MAQLSKQQKTGSKAEPIPRTHGKRALSLSE